MTSGNGTFLVTDIPAEHDTVQLRLAAQPGYTESPYLVARVGGEPLQIVLLPGGEVQGRVRAPEGVQVASLSVYAFWLDREA